MVLGVFVGGILLLRVWGLNPKWLFKGGGDCGPCPVFYLYPGIQLTHEEDQEELQSGLSRRTRDISVNMTALLPSCCYWSSD
jgi:hypothetical protein